MFPSRRKKERRIETGYDPRPISVLHVSTPKSWRGGEQQLTYLYDELEGAGVQQSILCPKGSALEADCLAVGRAHASFGWKGPSAIGVAWKLRDLVKSYDPDLIHTHDSHAHTAAFLATVLFRVKCPIIVHRRVDFPVGKSRMSRKKYEHPMVKRVIAVSEAIRRIGSSGVKEPQKWTTVHSGIDPDAFRERGGAPGKLRKELGVDPELPIIGNVAALADHKDHPTLLSAARLFLEKGGKAHFVIVGEGPERAEVENQVKEEGLEEDVSLLGFRSDVRELMRDFDLFLMSSKTEGLGTSILDAMAAGIPIVSTNAGGIPEIVEDGRNGILCDVGDAPCLSDALLELLGDDPKKEDFAQEGVRMARERTREKMANSILRIYRAVLEQAR